MDGHWKLCLLFVKLKPKEQKISPLPPLSLDFPCSRPGKGFVPNFPMFAKTDVNGKDQNPIYTFLKVKNKQLGFY